MANRNDYSIPLAIRYPDAEIRRLAFVFSDQLPFAIASALTKTAALMVMPMRDSLRKNLDVRSRGLPAAAFSQRRSVVRAEKSDFPKSKAYLGVPDDPKFRGRFLLDHIQGGTRTKNESGHRFAIPTRGTKRNAKGRLAPSKSPSGILAKSKGYLDEDAPGGAIIGLRKGRRARDRRQVKFNLREKVEIVEVWPFEKDAAKIFKREYPERFRFQLLAAAKSAKKKTRRKSETRAVRAFLKTL